MFWTVTPYKPEYFQTIYSVSVTKNQKAFSMCTGLSILSFKNIEIPAGNHLDPITKNNRTEIDSAWKQVNIITHILQMQKLR